MSLTKEQHIAHCVSQTKRFSQMLMGEIILDRGRDEALGQLAFNLGQYVGLAEPEAGRELWQKLAYSIDNNNYTTLIEGLQ